MSIRIHKNKILLLTVLTMLLLFAFAGCKREEEKDDGKLQVIVTIFSYYDFAKAVGGDYINVSMLVPAGKEAHSFEPSASDLLDIEDSDVFIYNGGEMESWVARMLSSIDTSEVTTVNMMDVVDLHPEETVEGMEGDHEHDGKEQDNAPSNEEEYDEHIWTSPENAKKIVNYIVEILSEADPEHKEDYKKNGEDYIGKINEIQRQFQDVVDNAERKQIVFGDRYPFLYFSKEFGLEYRAAFSGCSSESEPSAATLAYLINYVKENEIPVVYYIELSQQKIADTICEATGAKKRLLHSCHNVTKEELDNGVTWLSLMEQNIENLKEGLN